MHELINGYLVLISSLEEAVIDVDLTFRLLPATLAADKMDSGVVSASVLRLLTILCFRRLWLLSVPKVRQKTSIMHVQNVDKVRAT